MTGGGFTKLFQSIIYSSVWQEPAETKVVWVTMMAMADQHGCVGASIIGLAKQAGVSIEQCEKAIEKFLSPDKYSRTPDYEGRRIEKIDGGWVLLNHAKYRRLMSAEDRREKARVAKATWRASKKPKCLERVLSCPQMSSMSPQAEAEAEEKTTTLPQTAEVAKPSSTGVEGVSVRVESPDDELIARATCDKTHTTADHSRNGHSSITSAPDVTSGQACSTNPCSHSTPDTGECLPNADAHTASDSIGPTSMTSTMFPGLQTESKSALAKKCEEIYWAYPRHVDKLNALKAIEKALKTTDFLTLLHATQAFAASPAGQKGNFTPYPASWFNAGGYLTDPKEWYVTAPAAGGTHGTPPASTKSAAIASMGTKAVDIPSPRRDVPYAVSKAAEWKCSIREYYSKSDPAGLDRFMQRHPEFNVDEKR